MKVKERPPVNLTPVSERREEREVLETMEELPMPSLMAEMKEPIESAETVIDPPSAMETLFKRAVCLTLTLGKPGNHRKFSTALLEVDADRELLSLSKTLLKSEPLAKITTLDGEVRRFLYSRGLPSLFRDGVYLLPITLIEETEAKLEGFRDKRSDLIETFLEEYPKTVEASRLRLRALYNPSDYPPSEKVQKAFLMEWQYLALSVPDTLQSVSRDLFHKAQEKAQAQWSETLDEVRGLLRENLSDLVSHLIERLTPGADGKPKIFRKSLVLNLTEFLTLFEARNLSDDHALQSVVERAKALLTDVEPEEIRASKRTRQSLREGFADLKTTLDTLVSEKPSRAFHFEEA